MFDGSSVNGWKAIHESDMVLMPDPETAVVDIFSEEATLNVKCDVVDPITMKGYERCPRSAAKRAEAYMKSTGIADEAFFGPENEFFVFDMLSGQQVCRAHFMQLSQWRLLGILQKTMKMETRGIDQKLRADIFLFLLLILFTIFVQQCAWRLTKWA